MWFLFVALPLMYNAAKINSFKKFISQVVRPLIAFSIIFEYIFGLYTFDLWIEFLIIPIIIMVVGVLTYSKNKPEYKSVYKLANGLLTVIGVVSLSAVLIHLFNYYTSYLNWLALIEFVMPLFLSLMFLPLLYGIAMFTHYETTFVALKIHFKSNYIYRYAMLNAMFRFHGDLEGLERWKRMVFTKNLRSRDEIDEAIDLVKTMQKAEKNPHTVNEMLGWSPYLVKDLLAPVGIETADYRNTYEDEFCAISLPFKLSDEPIFSDTITYMVLGNQLIATQLELGLKVYNSTTNNSISLMELLRFSEIIYLSVLGEELPNQIKSAILKGANSIAKHPIAELSVKKDMWTNQTKGYSLNFKITHFRHELE